MVLGSTLIGGSEKASATPVPGEYSLEAALPGGPIGLLGQPFVVQLRNDHALGGYSAVQFDMDYDETIVSFVSGAAASGGEFTGTGPCTPNVADNGLRVLAGCIDIFGNNITQNGVIANVTMMCDNPGPAFINLVNSVGGGATTFVKTLPGGVQQPIHTHSTLITCVPYADLEVEKTGPVSVNAGDPITYTVTATNNGPFNATSVVIGDDLDDSLTFVSATVDLDVDGDSILEVDDGPCAPGFFAAFPNPFPPPALLTNVVACSTDLIGFPGGLQPGGTFTATINTTSDAVCNRTLVDLALAASTDDFGGTLTPDADLLDGADLPAFPDDPSADNNFDVFVTQVTDCPVTVTKVGPAAGQTGNADQYVLTVANAGPSTASNVVVTDVVPAGLTVTGAVASGIGDCTATVGNNVSCSFATLAPGPGETITISFTEDSPGAYCNTANATWDRFPSGADASNEVCFTVIPPFNGLVKGVDGQVPEQGESSIAVNLWLCEDQATDGIDNDGNSTVDDEDETCTNNGEGALDIEELVFTREDCDTRNDDDDNDGQPVSNDPNSAGYRPECPEPTLADYQQNLVDKDGGELPEGLGALEFQLKFDHKIFTIDIDEAIEWANDRDIDCTMTIVTENDIRFGCVTTDPGDAETDGIDNDGDTVVDEAGEQKLGLAQAAGEIAALIHVEPFEDIPARIRPTKDNGVLRRLLDENCEVADIFGDIFPNTNAGLTPDCTDIDITVRRLEGDVDMDCDVDINDSQLIAFRYGSFFGHLVYNQNYDLEPWPTADFDIDIKDLQFVFGRLGSDCVTPIPDNQDPQEGGSVGQP
jgi:uncharacterized repeat protein (TIGR01451 family)